MHLSDVLQWLAFSEVYESVYKATLALELFTFSYTGKGEMDPYEVLGMAEN